MAVNWLPLEVFEHGITHLLVMVICTKNRAKTVHVVVNGMQFHFLWKSGLVSSIIMNKDR